VVVFSAVIGVLALLGLRARPPGVVPGPVRRLDQHAVLKVIAKLVVPVILLFALYVQFHGEYGPGGGFQAGAIIATGLILHALLEGESAALRSIPRSILLGMVAGGAALYTLVGVTGMVFGGNFLDYSVLAENPVKGQQIGILAIEAGVGVTVCGALLAIFHAFAARD